MKRRTFLKNATWSSAALSAAPVLASDLFLTNVPTSAPEHPLKISLAQWSLHRSFNEGNLKVVDFANIAMDSYEIEAVEYVNTFYMEWGTDEAFWNSMKEMAANAGVSSLLIMVDDEGDLGIANDNKRKRSVKNHFKWVNAAKILGCHSIRVNAFGDRTEGTYRTALIDSIGRLGDYASKENINVLIENHGLFSSDAKLMADVIQQVDKSNVGTLPDFGNWCLTAKYGSTQGECKQVYDRYQGVSELLPYAKGVSAKSYNFNESGEDRIIDYYKMLKIVKDSGYKGYIGIEYEGTEMREHEGILATKALLENAWNTLN